MVDAPAYHLQILSREDFYLEDESKYLAEKLQVKVKEFEDICPAQTTGTYAVIMKFVFL